MTAPREAALVGQAVPQFLPEVPGRLGVTDDIAKAIIFLADEANFMTGAGLVIDGE